MTYIVIADETYPVDTAEQCEVAAEALREAGLESAAVWTSPLESLDDIASGDPDAYRNGNVLFAAREPEVEPPTLKIKAVGGGQFHICLDSQDLGWMTYLGSSREELVRWAKSKYAAQLPAECEVKILDRRHLGVSDPEATELDEAAR